MPSCLLHPSCDSVVWGVSFVLHWPCQEVSFSHSPWILQAPNLHLEMQLLILIYSNLNIVDNFLCIPIINVIWLWCQKSAYVCYNFSLHSYRFHLVFGAKKDRGRGFLVLAAQEMKQEPKNERGGRGRGRKETLADKPQVSCNVFSCWVQLVSVFLWDVKFSWIVINRSKFRRMDCTLNWSYIQLWRITL